MKETTTDASTNNKIDYDLDAQVGFRLRLAMQRHTEQFFKSVDVGLTQPQFGALARLYLVGEFSQNELGRSIALDTATIVGVVSRLEARGLIKKFRSQADRRRVMISLTTRGITTVEKAMVSAMKANELTLKPLTGRERKRLLTLLLKLVETDTANDG